MKTRWTRQILLAAWCAFAGAVAAFPSVLLAQPAAPVRVGGALREPKKVKNVPPVYPEVAKTAGLEAVIILESTIDERGDVVDIKPLRDVPPLTRAAVDAVKQWQYEPTLLNGVPVAVVMSVTVNFVLSRPLTFSFSGLLTSLEDESEHVRAAAARTLGQLRVSKSMSERAVSALEKAIAGDPSARVREAAALSLSQLDGRRLPEPEEPQPLSTAAKTRSDDVAVITPEQAAANVGRDVVVQGLVAQIGVSEDGDSLFLNFGGMYPFHVFNAVIFKQSLQRFPDAHSWEGKTIKIRGAIQRYKGKGKPEIILEQPEQVTIDSSPTLPGGTARPRMTGEVEGGRIGGEPAAPSGGGTGADPAMDYDSPPRPIKITRPQYPQEAFARKVEGTVLVEILIDSQGRVVRARVLQSIPLLDAAALQTVYQWVFQPAVKHGRPVATIAQAPVAFRIYTANEVEQQRKQRQAPIQ